MIRGVVGWASAVCAAMLLCSTAARAEISISITISGDIEEILPILEMLQQLGPGPGDPREGDALRLEVHSFHEEDLEPEAPEEDAPPPGPGLALEQPALSPGAVEAGMPLLLTVDVVDEAGLVDTVSATLEGAELSFDLYDNGMHGDKVAGDGTWSASVLTPETLPAGKFPVVISAYDVNGLPVAAPGAEDEDEALTATAELEVVHQ